jgi:hypothetical protein
MSNVGGYMPTHFVVSTKSETPKLYLAQFEFDELLNTLRSWTDINSHQAFVYVPKRVGSFGSQLVNAPLNTTELALQAVVKPHNKVDNLMWAWGLEMDDIPYEQAQEKLQEMADFVDKKRIQINARNVREDVEVK